MAFAAMARRLHQISPTLPLLVPPRLVRQAALVQEQRLPDREQETPAERRGDLVGFVTLRYRRLRIQVSLEVAYVLVGQVREGGIGKYRKIGGAVRRLALAQRPDEVLVGPAADAGFPVRRYVGRVECPKRSLERPASRQPLAGLRYGMAAQAIRRVEDIFTTGDRIAASSLNRCALSYRPLGRCLLSHCGHLCRRHSAGHDGQRDAQTRKP